MDYLAQYPVDIVPQTWGLNGIFLRTIREKQEYWAKRGYGFKFGQEHEFGLLTVSQFDDFVKRRGSTLDEMRLISPCLAPSLDLYMRFKQRPVPDNTARIIGRLTGYVRRAADMADFCAGLKTSKDAVIEQLLGYRRQLDDKDKDIASLAHRNAYLAFLHLMPASEGGLRDLIQPRFGSRAFGVGWWDWPDNVEVRSPPTANPLTLIRTTHRIFENIFKASDAFQIIPCFDMVGHHMHFSLWQSATGRNVMRMETEEDRNLAEKMKTGLYTLYAETPQLLNDYHPSDIAYGETVEAGGFRQFLFRQTGETWEIRRSYPDGFCHTARDLAMIMSGTAYGAFEIKDIKAHQDRYKIKLEQACHPVVENKFGGEATFMQRLIEGSYIEADGHLTPGAGIIERYIMNLRAELGRKNLGCFTFVPKGKRKAIDLHWQETWQALVKSIRMEDDNTLSFEHLHPEIQELLSPLRVTGRRNVLKGGLLHSRRGLTKMHDTLPELVNSDLLRFTAGAKSMSFIKKHFEDACATNLRESGIRIATLHAITLQDNDGKDDKKAIATHIYNKIIGPTLGEECAALAFGHEKEFKVNCEDLTFLKDKNSVRAITPHYQAAILERIEQERNGQRNNYLISQLYDTLEFSDKDIFDASHYTLSSSFCAVFDPALGVEYGVSMKKALEEAKMRIRTTLFLLFRMAAQDGQYSANDAIEIIEKCKANSLAFIHEERKKLNMPYMDQEKKEKQKDENDARSPDEIRRMRKEQDRWHRCLRKTSRAGEAIIVEEYDSIKKVVQKWMPA